MAFLRPLRSCRAVAPVVGTIMLVAITVVLAAVLFVILSSFIAPPPPPPAAITFSSQGWSSGNNTASITSATGVSAISVGSLEYVLKDPDGTPYYGGPAGSPSTVNSVTVNVHYRDLDGDDRISAGDLIIVEVTPPGAASILDGGVFEIHYGGRQIASHSVS